MAVGSSYPDQVTKHSGNDPILLEFKEEWKNRDCGCL